MNELNFIKKKPFNYANMKKPQLLQDSVESLAAHEHEPNDYTPQHGSAKGQVEGHLKFLNLPNNRGNRRLNPMTPETGKADGSKSENVRYRRAQKDVA